MGKLIYINSNGRTLEVREVSTVIYRMEASTAPLPLIEHQVLEDWEAKGRLEALRRTGLYTGRKS